MSETRATLTDLRQNLASLINRAAYGGERIVLVSHGEPKAAIISIEELRRLQQFDAGVGNSNEQFARALAAADQVYERIRSWQQENGIAAEDSAATLSRLREERDDNLGGLH